jgi:hypothetical protein
LLLFRYRFRLNAQPNRPLSPTRTGHLTHSPSSPSLPTLPDMVPCGSADRDRLRAILRDEMARVYFAVPDDVRASMRTPNDAAVAIEGWCFRGVVDLEY